METKKIEDFFQQIGFISPTCTSLTSYLGNINVLFANKKCQRLLSQARKLMKMELFNTIQLDEKDNSNNKWSSFIAKREDSNSKDIDSQIERLSENTLKFPACAISESCMELLTLVHEMMEEACISGHAACTTQILYTIRSMFELYTSVVSDHHRNSIETLPQVSALYYNNCMFLSHQMILLASQYKPRLSSILQDVSAVTFVDLVPLLRAQGTESFLDQIQFQKENLLEYLQAAEGFKYTGVEERYQIAHQSIKQCIHQLSHLKRVWVDVLPASNYSKSIGHLTACVVKEMMSSIMSLEDMSSDDAAKLHQLITMVREAAPALFPGDKVSAAGSLMKHCSGWSRFLELDIVLTASLHDIVDRWSEGKGPLAAEYSPEQVKSLIRALFQNTDRRAATLAKIC
ncbi:ZW10 [Bugula neritina]|uniref:ZW10 n=1 Tax=Bugula neritina TaxID=10212 RepID=A0A7J7JEM5_BUGNE|nr:ZW10 [Bugula neritina]